MTQIVRALLTSPGLEPREITSPINEVDDATLPSLIHSTIFQNFQVTLINNLKCDIRCRSIYCHTKIFASLRQKKNHTAMIEIFIEKMHKQPPTLEKRTQRT